VAAVDVAKASGVVCMRTPDPSRPGRFVNRIWDDVPATRARVAELGRELLRCQVQMVTLESTSDYWRVWFYVLESIGLAVQLVSASQAKNLKGRPKTDPLTELPGGVPQVSGRRGALVATVADHDHRRRCAAGPVPAGDAAGRVA
jgi:transposase